MGIQCSEQYIKSFSCHRSPRAFKLCSGWVSPEVLFQVIPQTTVCLGGCRLILHDTTTHHFLLFQRDVPSSRWNTKLDFFLPSYISKSRIIEKNVKLTKHGKCRNGACKTIAAFLCPSRQRFPWVPLGNSTGNAPFLWFRNGIPLFNTPTKTTPCCSLSPLTGGTKGKDCESR